MDDQPTTPSSSRFGLLLGPLAFGCTYWLLRDGLTDKPAVVGAMALWMLIWWVLEVVPLFVTALLPVLILPLAKISPVSQVTPLYASDVIFLFLGGFLLARAIEKWKLHEFAAQWILRFAGQSPIKILLAYLCFTSFLSMWISNTAAVLVMLPLAIGLFKEESHEHHSFSKALKLGVAYAASFGGLATIIGSPPNGILVGFLRNEMQMEISFVRWMMMGVPFAALGTLILWIFLGFVYFRIHRIRPLMIASAPVRLQIPQRRVIWIFMIMTGLWILTSFFSDYGLTDTIVSILGVFLLFIVPSGDAQSPKILSIQDFHKISWPILILFGGGLALSHGVQTSGLSDIINQKLQFLASLPPWLSLFGLVIALIFLTEFASNTAVASVFVPLLASAGAVFGVQTLPLLAAVVFSSSLSFMLPSATPPNAAVFSHGNLRVVEMMRVGIFLNLIVAIFITAYSYWIVPLIWH